MKWSAIISLQQEIVTMPWTECRVMDQKLQFIAKLIEGEKMAPPSAFPKGFEEVEIKRINEILMSYEYMDVL